MKTIYIKSDEEICQEILEGSEDGTQWTCSESELSMIEAWFSEHGALPVNLRVNRPVAIIAPAIKVAAKK